MLSEPLTFTKGARVLKVPVGERSPFKNMYGPGALLENETRLYDLETDPGQQRPIDDGGVEADRLRGLMAELMRANDAPPEAFARLDLDAEGRDLRVSSADARSEDRC